MRGTHKEGMGANPCVHRVIIPQLHPGTPYRRIRLLPWCSDPPMLAGWALPNSLLRSIRVPFMAQREGASGLPAPSALLPGLSGQPALDACEGTSRARSPGPPRTAARASYPPLPASPCVFQGRRPWHRSSSAGLSRAAVLGGPSVFFLAPCLPLCFSRAPSSAQE